MFTPHVTVACVVQAQGKFLIVEETIHSRVLWNQPAGHAEAGETLLQAAQRELWEESGIEALIQDFLHVHQWVAPDGTAFLRFLFAIDLNAPQTATPHDADIDRCLWLPPQQIMAADNLRSPLVADSIACYLHGERYPLSLLSTFH